MEGLPESHFYHPNVFERPKTFFRMLKDFLFFIVHEKVIIDAETFLFENWRYIKTTTSDFSLMTVSKSERFSIYADRNKRPLWT